MFGPSFAHHETRVNRSQRNLHSCHKALKRQWLVAGPLIAALLAGCVAGNRRDTSPTLPGPEARRIEFSGREWIVRPSGRHQSPGPNNWTDDEDSLWVDDNGLHLTLRPVGGSWPSVELSTSLPPEAVHVAATLETPLDRIDPRAVTALFIYRDDLHEADIEFSRWGAPGEAPNAQFAVAPYGADERHRFRLPGDLSPTRHVLDWRSNRVAFHSGEGPNILEEWRHTSSAWTEREGYRLFVNLWLYEGRDPLSNDTIEVVFSEILVE